MIIDVGQAELQRLAAAGSVMPGWTPAAWVIELRRKAETCATVRPDLAAKYRSWAANVQVPRHLVWVVPVICGTDEAARSGRAGHRRR